MTGATDSPEPGFSREAWVLATLPHALAYAVSLLRDRSLAEDVAHDCYVRLLAKANQYDLARDGTKLLYKAITNACVDRNYRDRRNLSLDLAASRTGGGDLLTDGRALDPHQVATQHELEAALVVGLDQLTVAQRGALEMSSLGFSLVEIGAALGTSPGNAGVLIHRARKAIADHLAPYLDQHPHE